MNLISGKGETSTRLNREARHGSDHTRSDHADRDGLHGGERSIYSFALVAPTAADARDVMVEGESGLLAIGPPQQRPQYEPTKRRLTWPNGAIATT
jgi:phage terminase large subunit-like protein